MPTVRNEAAPVPAGSSAASAVSRFSHSSVSGGVNKPVWLWWSGTGATSDDVNRCWQSFLRRFDIEHTFRLFKQTLGWTKPCLRSSEAADRWTWLGIAAQPRREQHAVKQDGQHGREQKPAP